MLGKLLDKASYLKAKIKGDELELALNQATNDDDWQASTTVLHEISSSAYNHQKWKKIHDFLWDKLKSNNKNWRKMLKVLNIIDFILKNGPGFAINELKYEINFFATLTSYQEIEGGSDRGASIRQRAKEILGLLENEEVLEDERLRAKQIRQKMSHLSGTASWNSQEGHKPALNASKYESFNSKTFEKTEQKGEALGYYNYGSGNYGDREEDVKYNHDYFQNLNRFKNSDERPKSSPQIPQRDISNILNSSVLTANTKLPEKATKNQSSNKPKFDSISQKLSKNTFKNQDGLIKPDLSYKKKDAEQYLIDTQAYFIETRYNFHQEQTLAPVQLKQSKKPQSVSPQSSKFFYQETESIKKETNLLTEFQGLSFLGVTANTQQPANEAQITSNMAAVENTSIKATENKQATVYQTQNIQSTLTSTLPQTTLSSPATQSQTPIINYSLTYNQIGPIQPTYNTPYPLTSHYGQFGYNANPYQPAQNINPYGGFSPYPQQSFQQHVPHYIPQYSGYSHPYHNHQPSYNQFSGASHYAQPNLPNTPISLNSGGLGLQGNSTSNAKASLPAKPSAQPAKPNIQNIGWTTNKEKNLTDLSDLVLEIGESTNKKVAEKPKQTNNRLKIDQWAW